VESFVAQLTSGCRRLVVAGNGGIALGVVHQVSASGAGAYISHNHQLAPPPSVYRARAVFS